MARKKIGQNIIIEQFSETGVHLELNLAHQNIEKLTAEIEELRSRGEEEEEKLKVLELRANLPTSSILKLSVSEIFPNPKQSRQTFNEQSLLLLARSIERDGQQQPILVFQVAANQYFLFDGERRWRAVLMLGGETIDAIIIPQPNSFLVENPEVLRRRTILVNHHREDLNPLDLAIALVQEIANQEGIEENVIPRLLNAVITRLTRQNKLKDVINLVNKSSYEQDLGIEELEKANLLKSDEKKVLGFLLALQLNPSSIKTNIFPMLSLFEDLKWAIQHSGLGGHHARVLQQLSAEKLGENEELASIIRQRITGEVIDEKLSVTQARERVMKELAKSNLNESSLSKIVQGVIERVDGVDVELMEKNELSALKIVLEKKLREVKSKLKS